jgi:hypothetical protein
MYIKDYKSKLDLLLLKCNKSGEKYFKNPIIKLHVDEIVDDDIIEIQNHLFKKESYYYLMLIHKGNEIIKAWIKDDKIHELKKIFNYCNCCSK